MKTLLASLVSLAALSAIPASAANATFNFTTGTTNANLSSYTATTTLNGQSVTATETAYYVTGTSSGPGSGGLTTAEVGEYNGNGSGVCESQSGNNCAVPNHQINNGHDTNTSGGDGTGTENFEFMLIKFSVAVNLSSIQLGNYGTSGTNGNGDPFDATYYVSSSSATSLSLSGTTLAGLLTPTGGGFTAEGNTTCTSGTCTVGTSSSPTIGHDPLAGTSVTYLLFGASTASGEAGTDFFKIQDLTVSPGTVTTNQVAPEPATFGLIGLSLAGLGLARRRRKVNN